MFLGSLRGRQVVLARLTSVAGAMYNVFHLSTTECSTWYIGLSLGVSKRVDNNLSRNYRFVLHTGGRMTWSIGLKPPKRNCIASLNHRRDNSRVDRLVLLVEFSVRDVVAGQRRR